jgi:hypothetical protein
MFCVELFGGKIEIETSKSDCLSVFMLATSGHVLHIGSSFVAAES